MRRRSGETDDALRGNALDLDEFQREDAPLWRFLSTATEPNASGPADAQLAVSNGLLGVRAVSEWDVRHDTQGGEPEGYIAGVYGQRPGPVVSPDLLGAPEWLGLRVTVGEQRVAHGTGTVLDQARTLDARRGLLVHELRWRGDDGEVLGLRSVRLASRAERNVATHVATFAVEGRATPVEVEWTWGATRPPLTFVGTEGVDGTLGIWRADGDERRMTHWVAMAADATLDLDGTPLAPVDATAADQQGTDAGVRRLRWRWLAQPGSVATLTRTVAFARGDGDDTRREATKDAGQAAEAAFIGGSESVLARHLASWSAYWGASDVEVRDDPATQRALRFALYHLGSAADPHDSCASVAARGLTGDGYRGHVFWDTETFILPFYTYSWPQAARALLSYRYHTLDGARRKAARLGYRGAFYAWESADTGDEATPRGVLGPDGRPVVYAVAEQATHISADVAYAVWHYWRATGDDAFLHERGAEILFETARFWASRVERDPIADRMGVRRCHLRHVVGPDEYHDDVDDNAYTNGMAAHNLARAADVADALREREPRRWDDFRARLDLDDAEVADWRAVADGLRVIPDPKTGLIEQFAGYFGLEYIDLDSITPRVPEMDLVLGQERTRHTQVIKQADVVMLLALHWADFAPEVCTANFRYYAPRCAQGSSLSPAMHALVAARLGDHEMANAYFHQAAGIDQGLARHSGNPGVHIATLGGLWQAAVFGAAGMRPTMDGPRFDPCIPPSWGTMRVPLRWRGRRLRVTLHPDTQTLAALLESGPPLAIFVGDERLDLEPGIPGIRTW